MSVPAIPKPTQLGSEKRTSVLPTTAPPNDDPGIFGPNYDFAGELPIPADIGVAKGDGLGDVIDAVKGTIYYTDMIGFGESSNSLTSGFQRNGSLRPLGINYFTPTGAKCSNGADMWMYVEGIPTGDGFGKKVKTALRKSGLPGLRGLAPGILEDSKAALNPMPILRTVFGTGYPKCRQVTEMVGDSQGRIRSKDPSVAPWIADKGDIQYRGSGKNRRAFQTKWVQDKDAKGQPVWMTQEQWQAEWDNRSFCPDGSPIASHPDKDCTKPIEKWMDYGEARDDKRTGILVSMALMGMLGVYMACRS